MLLAATLLGTVSNNIVNVPLREITADLGVGLSAGVLVVSGFILVLAVAMPLTGWVGDRFGRRRTLLVALALMAAVMLGAAVSVSLPMLVAFRAVQGLACAAIPPSVMGMLSTIYGPERRARLMSAWAAANGAGQVLGPPLGGALAYLLGWRAIFWVLAPVTMVVLAGCARAVPPVTGRPLALHWPGAVALTTGSALLITSATLLGIPGVFRWPAVVLAMLGTVFLWAFFVLSARTAAPLIAPQLLMEPRFLRSGMSAFAQMFCFGTIVVAVPLYVTGPMGRDTATTGMLILVLPAVMAIGAPAVGWLCHRTRPRLVLRAGLLVLAVAQVVLGCDLEAEGDSIAVLLIVLAATGLGITLVQTPSATGATRSPAGRSGAALGLFNLLRFAGSALGTAWVALIYPQGNLLVLFGGCAVIAMAGLGASFIGADPVSSDTERATSSP